MGGNDADGGMGMLAWPIFDEFGVGMGMGLELVVVIAPVVKAGGAGGGRVGGPECPAMAASSPVRAGRPPAYFPS